MTLIQYTCKLVQRHISLSTKLYKTAEDIEELIWITYKLNLVRRAQRRVYQ